MTQQLCRLMQNLPDIEVEPPPDTSASSIALEYLNYTVPFLHSFKYKICKLLQGDRVYRRRGEISGTGRGVDQI